MFIFNLGLAYGQSYTIKDIVNGDELIFYGYDFTQLKIADPLMYGRFKIEYLKKMNEHFPENISQNQMRRYLRKDTVIFKPEVAAKSIQNLELNNVATIFGVNLNPDTIQVLVDNYMIEESEGVGFVIIPECFDKHKESASCWFVLFDVDKRQIIYKARTIVEDRGFYGRGVGVGNYVLYRFWGAAVLDCFKLFIDQHYLKNRK